MNSPRIPQMIPHFDNLEKEALQTYMDSNPFLTEFNKTQQLENLICEFTGAQYAIMVSNGTMSLVAMMAVLGIGPGDKVYVPNYTMIATVNAVKILGAEPIFVDVEEETLCINIHSIPLPVHKDAKAIIFVSANGRSPSNGFEEISNFASANNLIVLEDSAQSLGSYYSDGKHQGTKGLMGSFSFSVPKIITMGQGGCIVTNDDEVAAKVRSFKDFGRKHGGNDFHPSFGLNLKITDLQAVIGIVQMSKLSSRIQRKKEVWARYQKNLSANSNIHVFDHDLNFVSPWFIDVVTTERENLIEHLAKNSIGSRRMYPPINQQPSISFPGSFPVSEKIGEFGLWLPSYVQITNEEIDEVCDAINGFYS